MTTKVQQLVSVRSPEGLPRGAFHFVERDEDEYFAYELYSNESVCVEAGDTLRFEDDEVRQDARVLDVKYDYGDGEWSGIHATTGPYDSHRKLAVVLTKNYIERQVEDWRLRVNALVDQVEAWSRAIGLVNTVERSTFLMLREHLMKRYGVEAVELPSLRVSGPSVRIHLAPDSLWGVGANGRVNCSVNGAWLIIFDMAEHFQKPEWRVVRSDNKFNLRDFNHEQFVDIVNKASADH